MLFSTKLLRPLAGSYWKFYYLNVFSLKHLSLQLRRKLLSLFCMRWWLKFGIFFPFVLKINRYEFWAKQHWCRASCYYRYFGNGKWKIIFFVSTEFCHVFKGKKRRGYYAFSQNSEIIDDLMIFVIFRKFLSLLVVFKIIWTDFALFS